MGPLYEQLKEVLREGITKGTLSPGERLPSERALSIEHHVSRITVKKALSDLIMEGLLEHLPGRKGTFVREPGAAKELVGLIAVAIDDVRESFGAQILRGIEDYLWGRRIHTLICNADRDIAKVEEYFRSLLKLEVAGVIFAPVIDADYRVANRRLVSLLEGARIPYTLVDRHIPGLLANYVGANHEESSRTITEHLIARGHRRILLLRGLECTSMSERVEGYRRAMSAAGIALDERLVVEVNDNLIESDEHEASRLEERIRAAGEFTCFYALNHRLFRAGRRALEAVAGRRHTSIQLAVHDEIPFSELGLGSLPHCVEPTYEMGRESARVLLEHIGDPNGAIVQKILKSRFVPVEGPPALS